MFATPTRRTDRDLARLRDQPRIRKRRRRDDPFGLAAFPTALDWHVWCNAKRSEIEMTYGWERFYLDAALLLQTTMMTLIRQSRIVGSDNPMLQYNSDGYVWGEETRMPGEIAREAFQWFQKHHREIMGSVPPSCRIGVKALEGAYLLLARFGRELDTMKAKGYHLVNVSATQQPDRFSGEEVA